MFEGHSSFFLNENNRTILSEELKTYAGYVNVITRSFKKKIFY